MSLAAGGLMVTALITLALGSYSNRLTIYVAPALSGLLTPYLSRAFNRRWLSALTIIALAILGFAGLIFSASTIYWDYSAGNPITYNSFKVIYSLGYHCNFITYYDTSWLTGYESLRFTHSMNSLCSYELINFNKNDVLYLASDISLKAYNSALYDVYSSSIIYNDGLNLVSLS